jgi:hypothetical protein
LSAKKSALEVQSGFPRSLNRDRLFGLKYHCTDERTVFGGKLDLRSGGSAFTRASSASSFAKAPRRAGFDAPSLTGLRRITGRLLNAALLFLCVTAGRGSTASSIHFRACRRQSGMEQPLVG